MASQQLSIDITIMFKSHKGAEKIMKTISSSSKKLSPSMQFMPRSLINIGLVIMNLNEQVTELF